MVAGVVEVMLPSTVRVQLLDARTNQHADSLIWRRGRLVPDAPDPAVLPENAAAFEMNQPWPLIADVQFRAQRATRTIGVTAPIIEHLSMWMHQEQLELDVRLRGTAPVRLRHEGGHSFEVLS